MRLGLIGDPLAHSWSPEIHGLLTGTDYKLWPVKEHELDIFFRDRDFDGINVTIPHKSTVLKYLDETDETVKRVGACNCIINENGRLKGYNTDVTGLLRMVRNHGVTAGDGEAAVLGSGGASKAAAEVCRIMGWTFHIVSRDPEGDAISYDELRRISGRITVLINATPVGMHPNADAMPVDPADFGSLSYVIDIVANPVRTTLAFEAGLSGVKSYGGLEMLVAQALAADELFFGKKMDNSLIDKCMAELMRVRRSIVLIGMPSSGKTTVGRELAEMTGRPLCDIDSRIADEIGMPIADYFKTRGEDAFRDIETEMCRFVSADQGLIIAAGGGVIKRHENMRHLAHNGLIVWLDRDFGSLTPTDSRPLSANAGDLRRLYEERMPLYEKYSDVRIDNNEGPYDAAEKICSIAGLGRNSR